MHEPAHHMDYIRPALADFGLRAKPYLSSLHTRFHASSLAFPKVDRVTVAVSSVILLVLTLAYSFDILPDKERYQIRFHRPAHLAKWTVGSRDSEEDIGQFVSRICQSFQRGFKGSWWLPNGHFQTLYSAVANFSNDDKIVYERQLIQLPDGGTFGIDVIPSMATSLPQDAPTVIINHGLTGGSHESYVRMVANWVQTPWEQGGFGGRAVVVNFRGCADTPVTSPHLYSSGSTQDTATTDLYLSSLYPHSPLFGIGFSLGGGVLTRFLGEQGSACRLRAAMVLCAPLGLRAMSDKLDSPRPMPMLYSWAMAKKMLKSLEPFLTDLTSPLGMETSPLFSSKDKIQELVKSRRVWKLKASLVTELVVTKVGGTAPGFPFDKVEDFMEWACPGSWIGRIKRPTLAIAALDDPVVSSDCIPYQAIEKASHFVLATVPRGGHLGWFDGPWSGPQVHRRWHMQPISEYFRAALVDVRSQEETVSAAAVTDAWEVPVEVERGSDDWTWVRGMVDGDTGARIGWKVVARGEREAGWVERGVMFTSDRS